MWRTFECLQVGGRPCWHDPPRGQLHFLHIYSNPFPSAARHQIIEHYNLFHDRGRRRQIIWRRRRVQCLPGSMAAACLMVMAAPSPSLLLVGKRSKTWESWDQASFNPLRKLEWRKQDGATTLPHSLQLTEPLISNNCIFLNIDIPIFHTQKRCSQQIY